MVRPAALGAMAGMGAAWWLYFRLPGRTLSTLGADALSVLTGNLKLNSAQMQNAQVIESEFVRAGLSWLVVPAIVNAKHESNLVANASGDNGKSIGLFQLHEAGAGAGFTVAQREDPVFNTQAIIAEAIRRGARSTRGQTNGQLTRWFAQNVERCWECGYGGGSAELDKREASVDVLFGAGTAAMVP